MIESYAHRNGHYSEYLKNIYNAYKKIGHEVDVLTFTNIKTQNKIKMDTIKYKTVSEKDFHKINNHIIKSSSHKLEMMFEMLTVFLTYVKMSWIINTKKYRNVEINTVFLNPLSFLLLTLGLTKNTKIIIHFHMSPYNHGKHVHNIFFKKIVEISSRLVNKRNSVRYICHSKKQVEQFEQWLPKVFSGSMKYIPHGVAQSNKISPNLQVNEIPHFLHFGVNHHRKDFETIFKAFSNIKDPYRLTFAGIIYDHIPENDPRLLKLKYGIQNLEIINKFFTEKEKEEIFENSDAVILAFKKRATAASGVMSDACTYLLPIISSDTLVSVKNNELGLTYKTENAEDLHEKIIDFIKLNPSQVQEIRVKIAQYTKANSWEKMVASGVQLFDTM
jgi:glycosyltransferase involved in cell wall biosynthesis